MMNHTTSSIENTLQEENTVVMTTTMNDQEPQLSPPPTMSIPQQQPQPPEPEVSTTTTTTSSNHNVMIYTTPPSGIGTIPTDLECLVSMEDITNENYVEYQIYPNMEWKSSLLSQPIIEELLQTQFNMYMERIQSSDCQAELKRLLQQGPPIYISDPYGLPLMMESSEEEETPNNNNNSNNDSSQQRYVMNLWYASDQKIHSSILHNAVLGEEHAKLWKELQSYLIMTTNTENDDTTTTTTTTTNNHATEK